MATKRIVKKTATKNSAPKTVTNSAPKITTKAVTKKTIKKTAPKETTVKSTVSIVKNEPEKQVKQETPQKTTSQQPMKLRRPYLILIIVIVLLGAALYYFRGLFVAAVVNGQPISRLEVVQQAEKQSGKTTLDTLVRDALIEQEAKKENVNVSDKEVTDEIATLENNLKKQGQTLNQVLAAQGMNEDDLRNLIRLDKLVQKMVGKKVTVSDNEVNDYISKNKASLPSTDEA